jgi:hypothetical protein
MINAELLYTLTQAGGPYQELSVHHLPRQAGRATGASVSVILRAFRELFAYAHKWRREEQQRIQQAQGFTHHEDESLERSHVFSMENQ